jgi:hypothetical protein
VLPVNNKLDWECEELKAKFPKTEKNIPVPVPNLNIASALSMGR